MTLARLSDVLQPALRDGYAVAGLVTLGWEDMRAYVTAAEELGCPVILQAGPGCRAHTPLPVLGAMFRHLAERASVPVVAHLDHGYTFEECREALARAAAAPESELAAEDLRLAVRALGRITGAVDVEDLLDVIFRDFCIGK